MCGIFCLVCANDQTLRIEGKLYELLENRGPNSQNVFSKKNMLYAGFVLWQQGPVVTPQPVIFENWTFLLNGDIFNKKTDDKYSDTSWLIKEISSCTCDEDIALLLKNLKGPYSLILFDDNSGSLYFARDPLGRNSLIIERDSIGLRILSNSCICEAELKKLCAELPPYGLFKLNVRDSETVTLYPWIPLNESNGLQELCSIFPEVAVQECIGTKWLLPSEPKHEPFDFYQLCSSRSDTEDIFMYLLEDKSVKASVTAFLDLLQNSVKERVTFTPKFCSKCIESLTPNCSHSKIGILFSGGIDCTILAIIADKFVAASDSIDLINVAFEAPNAGQPNWNVPDRCSAKESYEELTRLCPTRNWKLVEVNVTRKVLNDKLKSHIKHLIYPLNTVLDESLGCAFWFASQGQGYCNGDRYKSTARVIIIGSGADELFGGYTRHRNAFIRCLGSHDAKIANLSAELELDWQRLPSRNLGRDDRVIADSGKTSRAPFIQEDLVHFVRTLKPEQRCCFLLDQGVGDKLFLRLSGYQLGLRSSVKFKKRAIQFGSKIANKNQNAKEVSESIK